MEERLKRFEDLIAGDLQGYLHAKGLVGTVLQSSPDIEGKWEVIAQSYIPDGAREFGGYPTAVLAWMMYIGMAVAQYWETGSMLLMVTIADVCRCFLPSY